MTARFNELQDNQAASYLLFCAASRSRISEFQINQVGYFRFSFNETLIKVVVISIRCYYCGICHNFIFYIYPAFKESKVFRTFRSFARFCWTNPKYSATYARYITMGNSAIIRN